VLLFNNLNARCSFIFLAGFFLIICLFFIKIAPSKKPLSDCENEQPKKRQGFIAAVKYPVVILSAILLFFYAGSVLGFLTWPTTYFVSYNIKIFISSAALSSYYLFSILGLVITNFLIKKFKEINILVTGYIIGTVSLSLFSFIPLIYAKIFFLMIQGLAFACVFPLVKSIPIDENPEASGTIIGFLHAAQGIGVMIFQPILGIFAENYGGKSIIFVILTGQLIGMTITITLFILKRNKMEFKKF